MKSITATFLSYLCYTTIAGGDSTNLGSDESIKYFHPLATNQLRRIEDLANKQFISVDIHNFTKQVVITCGMPTSAGLAMIKSAVTNVLGSEYTNIVFIIK